MKILDRQLYAEDGTPLEISVKTFPLLTNREIAKTIPQIIEPYFNGFTYMRVNYNIKLENLQIIIYGYMNEEHTISVRYEIYTNCETFMKWRITINDASYVTFIHTRSAWIKCETVTEMIHQMATAYQLGSTHSPTIKRIAKETQQ